MIGSAAWTSIFRYVRGHVCRAMRASTANSLSGWSPAGSIAAPSVPRLRRKRKIAAISLLPLPQRKRVFDHACAAVRNVRPELQPGSELQARFHAPCA